MGFVSYLEDNDKRLDHQLMFISDHIESLRNSGVQTDYLNRIVQLRSELLAFQKTLNKDNLLDILGQLTREQQNRLQLEGNLREEQS